MSADVMQEYATNEHGVPQYPKGHAGRLLVTLAAIDLLERPSVAAISEITGCNRGSVDEYVRSLNDQFLTQIVKEGPVFRIDSWGPLLRPEGVRQLLTC